MKWHSENEKLPGWRLEQCLKTGIQILQSTGMVPLTHTLNQSKYNSAAQWIFQSVLMAKLFDFIQTIFSTGSLNLLGGFSSAQVSEPEGSSCGVSSSWGPGGASSSLLAGTRSKHSWSLRSFVRYSVISERPSVAKPYEKALGRSFTRKSCVFLWLTCSQQSIVPGCTTSIDSVEKAHWQELNVCDLCPWLTREVLSPLWPVQCFAEKKYKRLMPSLCVTWGLNVSNLSGRWLWMTFAQLNKRLKCSQMLLMHHKSCHKCCWRSQGTAEWKLVWKSLFCLVQSCNSRAGLGDRSPLVSCHRCDGQVFQENCDPQFLSFSPPPAWWLRWFAFCCPRKNSTHKKSTKVSLSSAQVLVFGKGSFLRHVACSWQVRQLCEQTFEQTFHVTENSGDLAHVCVCKQFAFHGVQNLSFGRRSVGQREHLSLPEKQEKTMVIEQQTSCALQECCESEKEARDTWQPGGASVWIEWDIHSRAHTWNFVRKFRDTRLRFRVNFVGRELWQPKDLSSLWRIDCSSHGAVLLRTSSCTPRCAALSSKQSIKVYCLTCCWSARHGYNETQIRGVNSDKKWCVTCTHVCAWKYTPDVLDCWNCFNVSWPYWEARAHMWQKRPNAATNLHDFRSWTSFWCIRQLKLKTGHILVDFLLIWASRVQGYFDTRTSAGQLFSPRTRTSSHLGLWCEILR